MSTDPRALLERLASGESAASIAASLRPADHREALKRCAVVRTFDRRIYDEVLTPYDSAAALPPFDQFVTAPEVERIPRTEERWRLERSARAAHWKAWWAGDADQLERTLPAGLRAFVEHLVTEYRTGDELELLPLLALTEPGEAVRLAATLFHDADARFDLPYCEDVLDILRDEDRLALCGEDLMVLRKDRSVYLGARSLWATEYLRTGTFLEAPGASADYTRLLGEFGPNVLYLQAPGGQGKTMELRWLIARRLVPEWIPPQEVPWGAGRIPCTMHDFDVIDPVNATQIPWLVLLDAAVQLNQQLPVSPFSEFLRAYGWALPLLPRAATDHDRTKAASMRLASEGPVLERIVARRFAHILAEVAARTPVVMVFDTVEEVHLRPQGALEKLLGLLREVMALCATVRVVLSGRYDLQEILGAAANVLPETIDRPLKPFPPALADQYLSVQRAVGRKAVRDEIVAKVGGDPFRLALFADLVQQRPGIEPAEIRRFDADLIYLILRVIRRIEEPEIRWLLRYGVLPRTLNREFVEAVMLKYLKHAMSGRRTYDSPADDVLPLEADPRAENFRTDLLAKVGDPLDLDRLWTQLRRYVGQTSWVSPVPGVPGSLTFHPRVMVAMRRVIQPRKVHRRMHLDAAVYFEKKAKADPSNWDRWLREALYHRFHLDAANAIRRWRKALGNVELGEPWRRESLASELLGPDYVDEHGDPREWQEGAPVIEPETVVEAWFERACALAQMARVGEVGAGDQLWSGVETAYAEFKHRQQRLGTVVIAPWRAAYLEAALQVRHGALDAAEHVLTRALAEARPSHDAVRLRVMLGDTRLAVGDRDAPATYRAALNAASRLGAGLWAPHLRLRLADAYAHVDRLAEADQECAGTMLEERIQPAQNAEAQLLRARIALRSGLLTQTVKFAEQVKPQLVAEPQQVQAIRVNAALAGYRDRDRARIVAGTHVPATYSAENASRFESSGVAAGSLMLFDTAFDALESARNLWFSTGDFEAVARCYTRSALLHLREVGSVTVAEHHLREAESLSLPVGSDGWLQRALVRVELLGRQNRSAEAAATVREVISELVAVNAPPRRLVQAAVSGLAIPETACHREWLALIDDKLREVTPRSARIVLLKRLDRVEAVADPEALTRLRRLLRVEVDLPARDRAALTMTLGHLARLAGDDRRAVRTFVEARQTLGGAGSRSFLRDWARALEMAGAPDQVPTRDVRAFVSEFRDRSPTLCAAFLIEHAEALLGVDLAAANRLARQAEPLLGTSKDKTQWHARVQQVVGRIADHRSKTSEFASHLVLASTEFEALGDTVNAAHVPDVVHGFDREKSVARLEASRGMVRLAIDADRLRVDTELPGSDGQPVRRHVEVGLTDTVALLTHYHSRLERSLLEAAVDLAGSAMALGSTLFPPDTTETGDPLELRLEIDDRRLHPVPWELALHAVGQYAPYRATSRKAARRDEIRFVQTGLNLLVDARLSADGYLGPLTGAALGDYQARRELPADRTLSEDVLVRLHTDLAGLGGRPSVVLLRPSGVRQMESQRGSLDAGVDVAWLYERSGFEVIVVENPSPARLATVARAMVDRGQVPAVVHLSGGLRQSSGGIAFTFLSGGWAVDAFGGTHTGDEITVTALDRLLSLFPQDRVRPVVVLDVDRPSGTVELALNLLLRNVFGGDLFALGGCSAVLGTGLVGDARHSLYEPMIEMLASGSSLGEIGRSLRARMLPGKAPVDELVPFAGVALFTHLPWLRVASPGSAHGPG